MFIFILTLAIIILYFGATFIIFLVICKRNNSTGMVDKYVEKMLEPYEDIIAKSHSWMEEKIKEKKTKDIYIKSNDNLRLHGIMLENPKNKGIMLEVHGYKSSPKRDLYASCPHYYNMGYSLLLIDNRATGKSEGKYVTFGIKESDDVINWCKYLNKHYPNTPIYLVGISMGATTIMMAAKNIKGMNVKCLLTDSGYISAYDEVLYCMKHYFGIDGHIFIDSVDMWCKLIAKFSLRDKNVLTCLEKHNIPLLLAHGEDDDFVPPENTKIIYQKYQGIKKMFIVPGAKHGMGYLIDHQKYLDKLKQFLDENT